MSLTAWVLLACAVAYATKLVGYIVPARVLDNPRILRVSSLVTVGLLASLVAVNAFGSGQALVLDARVAALAAAAIALACRAPYIVVVIIGALVAAGVRALGWG
ncbi:AzlD domain-containing protein [Micrococcales bacterium 31B]|nr:AzlD domain-containing protein [Micrococcales bacterium 31B]